MSSAKQKYEFSLKNEVNRLLNTKTIDELVFQLVTERKDHKQQVRRLKEKLNRRTQCILDILSVAIDICHIQNC